MIGTELKFNKTSCIVNHKDESNKFVSTFLIGRGLLVATALILIAEEKAQDRYVLSYCDFEAEMPRMIACLENLSQSHTLNFLLDREMSDIFLIIYDLLQFRFIDDI